MSPREEARPHRALAVAISALAALGAACSAARPAPPRAVSRGEALFETRCGRCHELPAPDSYPPARWSEVLDRMQREAGLDDEERQAVQAWVLGAARRAGG